MGAIEPTTDDAGINDSIQHHYAFPGQTLRNFPSEHAVAVDVFYSNAFLFRAISK